MEDLIPKGTKFLIEIEFTGDTKNFYHTNLMKSLYGDHVYDEAFKVIRVWNKDTDIDTIRKNLSDNLKLHIDKFLKDSYA